MNTARKIKFDDTVLSVKEQLGEASANAILINDPFKAIAYANYWSSEAKTAKGDRVAVCKNALISIEALMLKAIELSLSTYEVDAAAHADSGFVPDTTVQDVILEVVSKGDETTVAVTETVPKGNELNLLDTEAELDKPLLSALSATCRHLATTKGFKHATEFATKYLAAGNYTPKKDKQKAKAWTEKEIYSWLKEIKAVNAEKKIEVIKDDKKVTTAPASEKKEESNAAADGLTFGEVKELEIINLFMPSSVVEGQDHLAKRATIKKYTTLQETEEELKMLSEILSTKNKIKNKTFFTEEPNESELSVMFKKLEMFYGMFFKHRGYTEESVKAWRKATNDSETVKHFEILKRKETKSTPKNKVDPDIAKAKIIVVEGDSVNLLAVREQVMAIYKNGGLKEDLKLHPDLMELLNKEIKSDKKTPNLKFGTEELLLNWLGMLYDSVAKQIGPLTPATNDEIVNTVGKEESGTPSLSTFLALCTSAAKNDVSKEDFIKEHRPTIIGSNNKYKHLVDIGPKGSKNTVIFADDKDFEKWVDDVYVIQDKLKKQAAEAKIDKPPVDLAKSDDTDLVDNFEDLKTKGKELLSKGTPLQEFKKWIMKNMLNRKLEEQKEGGQFREEKQVVNFAKGVFKVDFNSVDNSTKSASVVDTTKAKTEETKPVKDVSQTVEPAATDFYSEADIAEIMVDECKVGTTRSFATIAKEMRDLYVSNKIMIKDPVTQDMRPPTIQESIEILETIVKEVNPEMYETRIPIIADREKKKLANKDQLQLPLDKTPAAESTEPEVVDAPHTIVENVDLAKKFPEVAKMLDKCTTLAEVHDEAVRFNDGGDCAAALSVCLYRIPTLEGETKGWTPEQIEMWFNTNILNAVKESVVEETAKETTEPVVEKQKTTSTKDPFYMISTAANKKYFRQGIRDVLEKTDTPEARAKVIKTIQESVGAHTKKFAKTDPKELHSMINNIIRRAKK